MRHQIHKRATLFNEEVEGFTYGKFSSIKIGIVVLALFSAFVATGWLVHQLPHVVNFMDVYEEANQ